ncbi:hypothetical protein LCGC14_0207260 [marine sediment metagenome]|jgi:hypothetical protein|uniref:Lipoprotein n=3 Tax=root TaxID=1 RepID=A0ABY0RN64_9RHOB|nr:MULTISPECIES: hypothetical protein [Sulfitobacter]SDO31227.1 hypothetical protein SAMN04488512_10285 [Sulfitobacter litoralis]|tara:strand:- start:5601 stop:5981 length:381 start_codon:yes stop_codon:yes gene_type:complete
MQLFSKTKGRFNGRLAFVAQGVAMLTDIRLLPVLICTLVMLMAAGCNMPSAGFSGLPVQQIIVDGSVFDVRVNGAQAEAIRINMEYAPRFGPIRDRAARAMVQASGCKVTHVVGDQAVAIGKLDCG